MARHTPNIRVLAAVAALSLAACADASMDDSAPYDDDIEAAEQALGPLLVGTPTDPWPQPPPALSTEPAPSIGSPGDPWPKPPPAAAEEPSDSLGGPGDQWPKPPPAARGESPDSIGGPGDRWSRPPPAADDVEEE